MLSETLKSLRKKKGYSQEEAASRLNVVRQTISKWEKGLSVPDAEMLTRLAELYEVTVGELLGAPSARQDMNESSQPDTHEIAEQLSRINEQLVIKNRRSSRIWKILGIIVAACIAFYLLMAVLITISFSAYTYSETSASTETITNEILPSP